MDQRVHHLQPRHLTRSEQRAVQYTSGGMRFRIVPCQLWWLYDTRCRNRLAGQWWSPSNHDHKHGNRKKHTAHRRLRSSTLTAEHMCQPTEINHFTSSFAWTFCKSFSSSLYHRPHVLPSSSLPRYPSRFSRTISLSFFLSSVRHPRFRTKTSKFSDCVSNWHTWLSLPSVGKEEDSFGCVKPYALAKRR